MQVAELETVILVVAAVVGAVRGGVGYLMNHDEKEPFNWKKLAKSIGRYIVVSIVGINALAVTGIEWTQNTIIVFNVIGLATDIGIDFRNG